jgi:hypothetical protein
MVQPMVREMNLFDQDGEVEKSLGQWRNFSSKNLQIYKMAPKYDKLP